MSVQDLEDVDRKLRQIKRVAEQRDFEVAHSLEIELHQDVLRFISSKGASVPGAQPAAMARAALRSLSIEFQRVTS